MDTHHNYWSDNFVAISSTNLVPMDTNNTSCNMHAGRL